MRPQDYKTTSFFLLDPQNKAQQPTALVQFFKKNTN